MGKNTLWVVDSHTSGLLPTDGEKTVVIPSGEEHKNWQAVEMIAAAAVKAKIGRDGLFVGIGGGVICDVTSFCASVYMRGCQCALVPTTLLAMVDASLGGKTAIDVFGIKNLVGSFHPAKAVYLCPTLLQSLPDMEFKNGLGEVLKHAILSPDDELAHLLLQQKQAVLSRQPAVVEEVVLRSLAIKRRYIEADPREESGLRAALNLGHTFAHALEAVGNLSSWRHGEAVAWGTVKALQAGVMLGVTDRVFSQAAVNLFESYGFDVHHPITNVSRFLEALEGDKKRQGGAIRFVIMQSQGRPRLEVLDEAVIRAVIG
jgi:3-dehydroquinate synthase